MRTLPRLLVLSLALGLVARPARAQDDAALARARAVEHDLMALIERVSRAYVIIGGGSGVIVSPDGEIITNHHVAGSRKVGQEWTIMRPGGVIERAKVVGLDERGDIALLKLEGPGPYPYVEMADSDRVQAGDAVLALGNPFGFSKDGTPHVTFGVVSAVHRFQGGYSDAIQTDTAINPGNSGGPLLDLEGRLIGINGRIAVRFGTRANTGVGYAIPTNQIRTFIPEFREKGNVNHGTIPGLVIRDTPAGGDGALVERVSPGSEAAARGLRPGDVIVEAAGRAVNTPERFAGIMGTLPAGATLSIVARRGAETVKVDLTLAERPGNDETPAPSAPASKGAYLGVRMSTQDGGGVKVEEVVPGSPAAQAGVQKDDVILAIGVGRVRRPMRDVNAFVQVLNGLDPGTKIRLTLRRGTDGPRDVEVTLGRKAD
jgi:S1-C subfamily serine protease